MLLLNTNVWLKRYWRLPLPLALDRLIDAEEVALSPVSALEIATKIRKGHFPGMPPLEEWLAEAMEGYSIAALTPEIAAAAGADPWTHQDPADRMIVHTAKSNRFTLAHTDATIRKRTDLSQAYFKMPRAVGH